MTPESGLRPLPVAASDMKLGAMIKSGANGTIYWLEPKDGVTLPDEAGPVAIKFPRGSTKPEDLQKEADNYASVPPHPNVLGCYGMQSIDGKEGLALEGISGRDMEDTMALLQKLSSADATTIKAMGYDKQMSQQDFLGALQYMLRETLQGLVHLEQAGKVHRDIRPANVLIDRDSGDVKIVDLGLLTDVGLRQQPGEKIPVGHAIVPPEYATREKNEHNVTIKDAAGRKVTKPSHATYDVFGAGEIARLGMERDRFRYGVDAATSENDKVSTFKEARAFGNSDTPGAPEKQALPQRPEGGGAPEGGGVPVRGEAAAWLNDRLKPPATTSPLPSREELTKPVLEGPPVGRFSGGTLEERVAALRLRLDAIDIDEKNNKKEYQEWEIAGEHLETAEKSIRPRGGKEARPEKASDYLVSAESKVSQLEMLAAGRDAAPGSAEKAMGEMLGRINEKMGSEFRNIPDSLKARLGAARSRLIELWSSKKATAPDMAALERDVATLVAAVESAAVADRGETGGDAADEAEDKAFAAACNEAHKALDGLLGDRFIAGTPAGAMLKELRQALTALWQDRAALRATRDDVVAEISARLKAEQARLRKAGETGAKTAYTEFVNKAMHPDPTQRLSARKALEDPFLQDPLLDDEQARDVLNRVLGGKPRRKPGVSPG